MATTPRATLEIPEGAVFELEADGLVIGFRDDVIIRGNIGHRLKKIWSENGSIELRSPHELVVEAVETKRGTVIIAGVVRAKSVKGNKVQLLEGSLAARSVNGETSIDLKGGVIEADLVMCPEVLVSAQVKGRATVIECQNELGAHHLKGGFKMAEFLEMMPNAQKVIQSEASHIPQLTAAARMPQSSRVEMPPPVAQQPGAPTFVARATISEDAPASAAVPRSAPADEPTGGGEADPASPADDFDAVPAAADGGAPKFARESHAVAAPVAAAKPARPAYHAALVEMCEQVGKVYTAQTLEVPPPIARLTQMIEDGEYAAAKTQLTTIWNQLIQHHKESKLPFAVKTTQMFQSIQRTLAANV